MILRSSVLISIVTAMPGPSFTGLSSTCMRVTTNLPHPYAVYITAVGRNLLCYSSTDYRLRNGFVSLF